ncbi:Fanconi anemia core complex-associated protein 20 [Cyprinodon tularosa]|uniref:Fanconi anemia core complex-associated protein 20 n=1 Tax=Cyprinodon tularosa TaxID=77115 RepID=UPI0018E1EB09|nr:Fanconi anemia core complex-associated protein 20 [Cyprinodon tularosa]
MAEASGSKSKLKRKKSCVEEQQADICSRITPKRSGVGQPSTDGATGADRSWLPAAAAWWNQLQPPAVESLWAFTLMSALPYLQNQRWDQVPDLPSPPAEEPTAAEAGEQWRVDLCSEVPPFPEQSPPPSPSGLDRQSFSSSQDSVPVQTRGPSSTSRPGPSQRPTGHRWDKAASSSSGQQRPRDQEQQSERLQTQFEKVFNQPISTCEEKEKMQSVKEEEALQSCPMCLHVFPAGFTQMEQDSHLAQCLSMMNEDMTW